MGKNGLDIAGGKLERCIIPTASQFPPSFVTSEALPVPDHATPTATNRSAREGVTLHSGGRLRQNAASDPTIHVRAEDIGRGGITAPDRIERDIFGGQSTAADLVRFAATINRVIHNPVPRVSIKRTGYDQGDDGDFIGVDTNTGAPVGFDPKPTGQTGTWLCLATAPPIKHPRRNALLFFFVATNGSATWLVGRIYDPAVEVGVEDFCAVSIPAVLPAMTGGLDCAPFTRGSELYVAISGAFVAGGAGAAFVQVIGDTAADVQVLRVSDGFSGGIGFPVRIAATDTAGGVVVAIRDSNATFRMARSDDLRTWDSVNTESALVQFNEFRSVLGISGRVTDTAKDSAAAGTMCWLCTSAGAIYRSNDEGKSWRQINMPTLARRNSTGTAFGLTSIAAYGNDVYAVGLGGLVVKSVDGNAATLPTFAVVSYTASDPATIFNQIVGDLDADAPNSGIPPINFYKVKTPAASRAFIAGANAAIYKTLDGGATPWVEVQDLGGAGTYTDIIVSGNTPNTVLLAVGTAGVHDVDPVMGSDRKTRAVLLVGVEAASPASVEYLLEVSETDSASLVAITVERNGTQPDPTLAATRGYILSAGGVVHRFVGDDAGGVVLTLIADLKPSGSYYDIEAPEGETAMVLVAGPEVVDRGGGYMWICTDADQAAPAFAAQFVGSVPLNLRGLGAAGGVVGTFGAALQQISAQQEREHPALGTLEPEGAVFFAAANITMGWLEIYRAPRPAPGTVPRWQLVDQGLTFTAGTSAAALQPSFCFCDDGTVVMTAGRQHRIGLDGGRRWVSATDPDVPLALQTVATSGDWLDTTKSLRGARRSAYFLGRIFSTAPNDSQTSIGVMTAWERSAAGTEFRPIVPGKPMWLGVDAATGTFNGDPYALDEWIIATSHVFSRRRLAVPSPSMAWRSAAIADLEAAGVTEVVLEWDRQAESIRNAARDPEEAGALLWHCNAMALIETNFRLVTAYISDPTNDAVLTSRIFDLALVTGDAKGPGGTFTSNILRDTTKAWVPGEFARGIHTYRLDWSGNMAVIVDNTETDLILDRTVTIPDVGGLAVAYAIYGDRLAWFGDGAQTGPGAAGLAGTVYEFGRLVGVSIPVQDTPEGYLSIGSPCIGIHPRIPLQTGEPGSTSPRSFQGLELALVTNTTEQTAESGVTSIRHYGRTGRTWAMAYVQEQVSTLVARYGALLRGIRSPFVVVINSNPLAPGTTDHQSAALVVTADAPRFQMTNLPPRFGHVLNLKELV